MRTLILAALVALGAITFAAPAAADPRFSLSLSGPSTGVVGQAMAIQVTGQNPPPEEWWFASWLSAAAIDGAVVPACPAHHQDAIQMATNTGGEWLAFARRENVEADGSWSATMGFVPKRGGRWLVCAYTEDGGAVTLAAAEMTVNVSVPPPSGGGTPGPAPEPVAKPANTKAPRIIRSKRTLVCDAGQWTGATEGYRYRWSIDGKRKRSGRRLPITRRLRGHTVTCSVTAVNTAGATTAVSRARRVS